jgi:hypothetical protein
MATISRSRVFAGIPKDARAEDTYGSRIGNICKWGIRISQIEYRLFKKKRRNEL